MAKYLTSIAVGALAVTALQPGAAGAQSGHDTRGIRHRIADAYGVHSFDRVERLSYTFNVQAGERNARRSWTWWPQEGRVRYEGGTWREEPFEYRTRDLSDNSSEEMIEVDKRFINDSYWLVFPFHVEWDVAAEVTDEGVAALPMGPEGHVGRKVVVAYPDVGGYTPGDVYELYVSDDYRVIQWLFREGGAEDSRHPITWEDEQRFGDITFSTDHVGPDGGLRVWFTDISVEFRER